MKVFEHGFKDLFKVVIITTSTTALPKRLGVKCAAATTATTAATCTAAKEALENILDMHVLVGTRLPGPLVLLLLLLLATASKSKAATSTTSTGAAGTTSLAVQVVCLPLLLISQRFVCCSICGRGSAIAGTWANEFKGHSISKMSIKK